MAEINVAPQLDADSFVAITPVTLDADGNPATYGMPQLIKLGDFAAWLGSGGSFEVPAATTTEIGGVKQSATIAQLTNNSGGTSGGNTIAAVTDNTSTANAVATLASKLNALIAALTGAGVIDGA